MTDEIQPEFDEDQTTQRTTFNGSAVSVESPSTPGQPHKFEILAITTGDGNGWLFSEATLQASLPLWENTECFIDHGSFFSSSRSLRDLAGVCASPTWDDASHGVKLTLHPSGPSAALLSAVAQDWIDSTGPRPKIGFSADISFTAKKNEVQSILRVYSLDLVYNPARGGAFVRALNQLQDTTPAPTQPHKEVLSMSDNPNASQSVQTAAATAQPAAPTIDLMAIQSAMLSTLLETRLAAANLPAPMLNQLRKSFTGITFTPQALDQAITDQRQLLADLAGPGLINGPRFSQMNTTEDRLQAALDDLLGAPREKGMETTRVERLSGFKELYLSMTGDLDLMGSYDQRRAKLATTATLPNLVKNALNKIIIQTWEDLGRSGYLWWQPVVSIQHFDTLQSITGILVGELGVLPTIAEGGNYATLNIADSAETGAWSKYGGYLPMTLELIDRDDVSKLRTYPRKLANAQVRKISSLIASIFTANTNIGPVMADTYNVFEAAHHANLGTTALSVAEWEVARAAVFNQPMLVAGGETAPKLAIDPRYLLVPRTKRLAAYRILYPDLAYEANMFSNNMQQQTAGDVVCVPDWTDAYKWAAVADPAVAPAIIVGERFGIKPEIFVAGDDMSPAMFSNDEVRLKVRSFLSVFVADYRPMYKENATS